MIIFRSEAFVLHGMKKSKNAEVIRLSQKFDSKLISINSLVTVYVESKLSLCVFLNSKK